MKKDISYDGHYGSLIGAHFSALLDPRGIKAKLNVEGAMAKPAIRIWVEKEQVVKGRFHPGCYIYSRVLPNFYTPNTYIEHSGHTARTIHNLIIVLQGDVSFTPVLHFPEEPVRHSTHHWILQRPCHLLPLAPPY